MADSETVPHDPNITLVEGFVPVIDLGFTRTPNPDREAATARAIGQACSTSGFFVVVGHGVPQSLIDATCEITRKFFLQPEEVKREIAYDPMDSLHRGWSTWRSLQKFSACRIGEPLLGGEQEPGVCDEKLIAPNRWPALPGFKETWLAYYLAIEAMSRRLHRLLALALDLPADWFEDKIDNHMTPLAANYFLPAAEPGEHGPLRTEAHTDFGTVTVLYPENTPGGGLQVRDRDKQWLDVPVIEGAFVINLGNLMAQWTNNRWASTIHRVVNPPDDLAHLDRISIPFFQQPNPDAMISCIPTCFDEDNPPRHAPVTAGEYFIARSRRIFVERRVRERRGESDEVSLTRINR
ncbi:2-oxoglutarate and iron-dependent oxygenase domain-containing protein [Actinoplanes sp. NBRC 103695]|uniref:isopenicillin N synthase family dioxygenase n=1 Tax=Actinoplanes sp. NBRC 103695 TaxID=3032202 RepID=UPI0024A07393|nr:2-oxoglutarate and iron-dependent oxygenase domain-containing protein [Actinoplanes sp. NBRC 103695]GLZ01173.1 2OG-Fe(II) oxygenase [Actinoplanes sp. NBRC 103695]